MGLLHQHWHCIYYLLSVWTNLTSSSKCEIRLARWRVTSGRRCHRLDILTWRRRLHHKMLLSILIVNFYERRRRCVVRHNCMVSLIIDESRVIFGAVKCLLLLYFTVWVLNYYIWSLLTTFHRLWMRGQGLVVRLLLIVDLRAVSCSVSSFHYHPMLVHLIDIIFERFTCRKVRIEQLRVLSLPVGHNSAPWIMRLAITLVWVWRVLYVILGLCKMDTWQFLH